MNSFKCFIVINTLQTLENIFDPYLQLCEIGQHIAMKCMNIPDVVCTQYTDHAVVVWDLTICCLHKVTLCERMVGKAHRCKQQFTPNMW